MTEKQNQTSTLNGRLSLRLKTVAAFVSADIHTAADVGCDHGYVALHLAERAQIEHVIAMDVRPGPLQRASEHIACYHMADKVETRLSDGVEKLCAGEAECLIIAGMGGKLTVDILTRGLSIIRAMKELILQPQSELFLVREFLKEQEFVIERETMLFEEGKYYTVLRAVPAAGSHVPAGACPGRQETAGKDAGQSDAYQSMHPDDQNADSEQAARIGRVEDRYGPYLLRTADPVLKQFLDKEKAVADEILKSLTNAGEETGKLQERRTQILDKLADIAFVEAYYYGEAPEDAYEMQ